MTYIFAEISSPQLGILESGHATVPEYHSSRKKSCQWQHSSGTTFPECLRSLKRAASDSVAQAPPLSSTVLEKALCHRVLNSAEGDNTVEIFLYVQS